MAQEPQVIGLVKSLVEDFLLACRLELIEFSWRFEGRNLVLMIITDKPEGGITLGACSQINRQLADIIEEKDLIRQSYVLEVSSPGLDRPLKNKNDFMRCTNKPVHVFLNEMAEGKSEWEGIIAAVGDMSVRLDAKGQMIELPLSKINWAKRVIN
jgi:ribosome maturation factor RimP